MNNREDTIMGVELYILGIRKLRQKEVKELTGKTSDEIEKSKYFREFFPSAPYDSWYRVHDEKNSNPKIARMQTPVVTAYGTTVYVTWQEELGYYWHKDPSDRLRIDSFFDFLDSEVNWDEDYHVVTLSEVRCFINRRPVIEDTRREIIAFLYG
jgi:hypothetical protein